MVWWDMPALGMQREDRLEGYDHVTSQSFTWGQSTYVRLDPAFTVAHIFEVTRA
jgi:starch synthase (maltosyl-transferring)